MQNPSVQTHRAQSERSRPRSAALSEGGVVSYQTIDGFGQESVAVFSVLSVSPEVWQHVTDGNSCSWPSVCKCIYIEPFADDAE